MEKIGVVVSLDEDHLQRVSEVARELATAGMDVQQVLDSIGVITGTSSPDRIAHLQQVDGVASVELDREVRIAPPDAAIQ